MITKEIVTTFNEKLAHWIEKNGADFRTKLESTFHPADAKFQITLEFQDPEHYDALEAMKKMLLKRRRNGEDLNEPPKEKVARAKQDDKGSPIVEKIRALLAEYDTKVSAKVVQSVLDGEPMPYQFKKALEEIIDDENIVALCKRKKVSLLVAFLVIVGFTCKNKEVNAEMTIAVRRIPALLEVNEEEEDVDDSEEPIEEEEEEEPEPAPAPKKKPVPAAKPVPLEDPEEEEEEDEADEQEEEEEEDPEEEEEEEEDDGFENEEEEEEDDD